MSDDNENNVSIEDIVTSIDGKNFNDAGNALKGLLDARAQEAIDQRKVQVASKMFNDEDDDDGYDFDDEELSDDEVDALLDEIDIDDDDD